MWALRLHPLLWRRAGVNDEVATTAAAVGRSNRNGSHNWRFRLIVHGTKLMHRRLHTSPAFRRAADGRRAYGDSTARRR